MITPIRENVLYLYVNGEFFRSYEEQEELSAKLDSLMGEEWALYDKDMNLVGEAC
jgi:hypothetical protein